jgi:hypothetical protein
MFKIFKRIFFLQFLAFKKTYFIKLSSKTKILHFPWNWSKQISLI